MPYFHTFSQSAAIACKPTTYHQILSTIPIMNSFRTVAKVLFLFATATWSPWSSASAFQNNNEVITKQQRSSFLRSLQNNNNNACQAQISAARTCLAPEPGCEPCIAGTFDGIFARNDSVGCVDFTVGICPAIASDCIDCAMCRSELESLYGCIVQQLSNGACSGLDCNLPTSDANDDNLPSTSDANEDNSKSVLSAGAMTLVGLGYALF